MRRTMNLLPWREMNRRALRKHFFIKSAFFFSLLLVLLFFTYQYQDAKLSAQLERNQLIHNEIDELALTLQTFSTKEVERDALERRLDLVNSLQKQRNNATLLFNLLPDVMPEGVVLDKVSMKDGKVKVEGRSHSNAQVAHFLARLEKAKGAKNVQIHSIINTLNLSIDDENRFRATFELTDHLLPVFSKESQNGR